MANPLTPDFDRNSNPGRLVTDRFDFALHYEGVAFRHDATMIDLKPDLTIGADFCTTVQEALEALLGIIGHRLLLWLQSAQLQLTWELSH